MSESLKKLKLEISDNRLTCDKVRLKGLVDDYIKNDIECHSDCYEIIILTIEFGFLIKYLSNIQNPSSYIELLKSQNYSDNEIKRILIHCEYLSGNCTYKELISTVKSNPTKKKSLFNFVKSREVEIKFVKVSSFEIMRGDEVTIEWGIVNYKKITLILDNQNKLDNQNEKVDVTNITNYKFSPTTDVSFYFLIENANFIQEKKSEVYYVRVFNKNIASIEKVIKSRQYDLNDFDELDIGGAFKVNINRGNVYMVEIFAGEDDYNNIDIKKSEGLLTIYFWDWRRHGWGNNATVNIQMPDIESLELKGACKAVVKGFDEDIVNMEIKGACELESDLKVSELQLEVSGASDVTLSGSAFQLKAEVSGASALDALDFEADNIDIEISGASDSSVFALKQLKADVSGASELIYKGEPEIDSDVSGFSSIKPKH